MDKTKPAMALRAVTAHFSDTDMKRRDGAPRQRPGKSEFMLRDCVDLDALEQNAQRVRSLFPNGQFTVDDVVSNGDKAAAHWTMTATHTAPVAGVAPTGKPIVNHGVVFYRFENGKIAELWFQIDQVGVLQQLGVNIPGAPAPAQQPAPAH